MKSILRLPVLAHAVSLAAAGLDFTLMPSTTSIHPAEPVGMTMAIQLNESDRTTLEIVFVNHDDLHFSIVSESGDVACDSKPWPWRCVEGLRHEWVAHLDSPAETQRCLVLNEWCSTTLPPGAYKVICEVSEIGLKHSEQATGEVIRYSPTVRLEFPITVEKRNDDAVRQRFGELLETARSGGANREARELRSHAIELIVYSRDPIALPYQLALFKGDVEMSSTDLMYCHLIDMVMFFIEGNRQEAAEGLVDQFLDLQDESKPMEKWKRRSLSDIVLWAIHEMHARGKPEVVEATEAIVSAYEKPRDPRPVPGLD